MSATTEASAETRADTSFLTGVAALYFKLSGGRAATALAEAIGSVESKHGATAALVAKTAADAVLSSGEQQKIFKLVAQYVAANKATEQAPK